MSTEIVEYSKTEAALADLAQKYKGVIFQVTTKEGLQSAVAARAELRGYRIALEKTRIAIKEPALRRTQQIDSEARRITAALSALEDPIDEQIKAETEKKKREEEAKAKAEADRIAAEEAAHKEAEESKIRAERAELDRQRAALEAEQRASRDKIEAEERAARMKMEEEARQARLAQQARDEVARQRREAEEAALKAERDKAEAARREAEDVARRAREAEERAAREIQRQKDELLDGEQMLRTFVQRYGKRAEFAVIVAHINAFLEAKQ